MKNLTITAIIMAISLMASACAQKAESIKTGLNFEQIASGSLSKKPTAPFEHTQIQEAAKQVSESKAPSLADRLARHPDALYWKEKNAYGYYSGAGLSAELNGKQQLILQDASDEEHVRTCAFGANGQLAKAINTDAGSCEQLMFSLDQALDE